MIVTLKELLMASTAREVVETGVKELSGGAEKVVGEVAWVVDSLIPKVPSQEKPTSNEGN